VIGVPGDPLADLNVVAKPENVQLVIKGGEVMKDLRIGQRVAG
jgi:imidazolonepropionase-like amidohydrolase